MIVYCEECNTGFNLDEKLLKQTGSKVRCSNCKAIFLAYPPPKTQEDNLAENIGIDLSGFNEVNSNKDNSSEIDDGIKEDFKDLTLDIDKHLDTDKTDGLDFSENKSEIDLSDIEDMLENVDDSDLQEEEDNPEDITLELDMDLDSEEAEDFDHDVADSDDISELDLSEMEDMLETEDDSISLEIDEEDDEELKLELDSEADEIEAYNTELEYEIKDIAFEDDLDKDLVEESVEEDLPVNTSVSFEPEKTFVDSAVKDKKIKKQRRKIKSFYLSLSVLILIAGGLYFGTGLLEGQGIKLPYLTDINRLLKSNIELVKKDLKIPFITDGKSQNDPDGTLKLYPLDSSIQGMYVENSSAGTLYVITGEIENDYDHPRSYISVTANIFTKKDPVGRISKTVFCGNILSHLELENFSMNALDLRLQNREGYNKSNIDIKAGNKVPFMIVFNNLPEDMESFKVVPAGSFP